MNTTANDTLDDGDELSKLFGGTTSEPRPVVTPPAHFVPALERIYMEKCGKCGGSGRYAGPSSHGSQCFKCQGRGTFTFKTSPEHRANTRSKAHARKAAKVEAKRAEIETQVEAWKAEHPAAYAWLLANVERGGFEFATSLWNGLRHFGSLTAGQLAAVERCIEKDKARVVEAAQRVEQAPAITVERIEQAFDTARGSGLKRLKLHLDTFVFKPASSSGNNPGAIYVTESGEYLGKIMSGKLLAVRSCGDERSARIIAAAADPLKAAVAYGKLTGSCSCCGRTLTDPNSIEAGIGPICATNWGM